jgi:eukaryotic-like serine/threonine-protein kinase
LLQVGAVRCPEENTWLRYLGGELEEPGLAELEDHLDDCASCRVVFADLARSTAHSGERRAVPLVLAHAEPLARGTLVGRYVILSLLGRGGMGVVYKAFDPELDRAIALKLVGLAGNAHARARLVREAKTLARVSHPNVVAVHDVGTHDDDVFVAMELCEGATLRAWLAERARPARHVLAVMLAAGAGLAAAHELGIVHRDFKPENVIVGTDGRVRVRRTRQRER